MTNTATSPAAASPDGHVLRKLGTLKADTIALWMILSVSSDTILFGTNTDEVFLMVRLAVYAMVTLFLLFLPTSTPGSRHTRWFFLGIACACGLTSLLNVDFTGGYIYQVWIIALGYLFSTRFTIARFSRVFVQYLYFLCGASLIGFALAKTGSSLLGLFPSGENSAGVEFTNLYITAVFKETAEVRNGSIFREPGVFMIYIILSLVFHLFSSATKSYKFIALAILALITTYSTAGYFVLVLVLTAFAFNDGFSLFSARVAWVFGILATSVSVFVLQPELFDIVFSKLDSGSASYGSSLARLASVVSNIDIYMSNPFVGSGLSAYGPLFERFSSIHFGLPLEASSQSTNTIMAILATYGTVLGLGILYALFCLARRMAGGKVTLIPLFASVVLVFSSQDMRYSVLFFILVFLGLSREQLPDESKNQKGVLI